MTRLAVALILAMLTTAHASPITPSEITVVDGDTIKAGGETYRLVGYDTPETGSRARCEAERSKGAAASLRLRRIVAMGGLDLARVACACRTGTEGTAACNHGRRCAVLRQAGRDVGSIMISEGLAREYVCRGTRCPKRGDWCGETRSDLK